MAESAIVLHVVLAMFLVMVVGWLARRACYLSDNTTQSLGRLVVDITFPSLVFTQMISTVNAQSVRQGLAPILLGALILLFSMAVAWLITRYLKMEATSRRTFIFLVAIPNWIFMPLPIVSALFGFNGVSTLLVFNISAQILLWSVGVGVLRGGLKKEAWLQLFINPGLLATFAGVAFALVQPADKSWMRIDAVSVMNHALSMIGNLTVPLSLLITGSQLGALKFSEHRPDRNVMAIVLARLLVIPVLFAFLLVLAKRIGVPLDPMTADIGCLIAAMPAAVSCGLFVERYQGDIELSARAVCYSTLVSIATIPVIYSFVTRWFNLLP